MRTRSERLWITTLLLPLVMMLLATSHAQAQSDDDRGAAVAETFWKKVVAHEPKDARIVDRDLWDEACGNLSSEFFDLIEQTRMAGTMDGFARTFAAKFPSGDPAADFKWFLATEEYSSPHIGFYKRFGNSTPRAAAHQRMSFLFAEVLAKRFIKERVVLERYQHFLAWRARCINALPDRIGGDFVMESGMVLYQKLYTEAADRFWWDTRNFLVLVLTTGREDLLPKTEADLPAFVRNMDRWFKWLEEDGYYLQPREDSPTWQFDEMQKRSGYGFMPFQNGRLPPLKYQPRTPFRDWPTMELDRTVGLPP